ncbi:Aconitase A [Ignavibacterium album JCM 16511]|uniref:Aconitate hydratase A n=1 Tax=Ignavibacterium album (strain DSM 19864 / JCM 16511 / NBRC 101810 / Mat9-16) TaxID=945713 RepID=I0AIQ4_IGNAJ|nr:homoaconitase [Ignavibacterium album]AFH48861.1 Aconitase A [Ignavibacterium album JCM 16511]
MSQTLIEKIAQRFAVGLTPQHEVHAGDYLSIKPAYVMTHDNTGAVIPKFKSIGATKLANPRQVVITLDHNVQDKSEKNLEKYKKIEEFAKTMGADFYPAGRGIGHQIMCEEGYAWPLTMAVASDSHSNMYGGLGCLGTPIVRTDAAAIWATGRTWWQVPPIAKVELKGSLRQGVTGKDLIIALCGYFNHDEVLNHAIEFVGDGVKSLSVDERLAIANMTTEWGALAGVFPVDEISIHWLRNRADYISKRGLEGVASDVDGNGVHPRVNQKRIDELEKNVLAADEDAFYSKELTIDLSTIEPFVSGPNTVKTFAPISEIKDKDIKIDKAYLVSCVNSRLDDIKEAAQVVKGKKVAEGVKFYIAAASSEVQKEAEKLGYWQTLLEAGAIPLPPGCGPCIGLGTGLLEDGEVGISATNRNFRGRMGSPNAFAYLASPAVVASSAIAGKIDYNWNYGNHKIIGSIKVNSKKSEQKSSVRIIDGFKPIIEGELIFCHQDNLNTDGIYPGKYTYNDDMTPQQQAEVVMENYDPEFVRIAKAGDILVGGFNFGTGSSREQAATALKYKGIQLVIAGTFNETYKRNALNNGFLLIECPELVNDLKAKFGKEKLTVKTGMMAKIDFQNSVITLDNKSYTIDPVGEAAQELIVTGGLEEWVKKNLESK